MGLEGLDQSNTAVPVRAIRTSELQGCNSSGPAGRPPGAYAGAVDILAVLALVAAVAALVVWRSHRDRDRRLAAEREADLRTSLRAAEDDTTRFGEELQDLHWETLTDRLDAGMRQDYRSALDSYEAAKELLREATSTDRVRGATAALEDGRYALAACSPGATAARCPRGARRASSTPRTGRPRTTPPGRHPAGRRAGSERPSRRASTQASA
jgi:type II secretory pathway pseudopilin PulG